jgi:hypothetical protein
MLKWTSQEDHKLLPTHELEMLLREKQVISLIASSSRGTVVNWLNQKDNKNRHL